MLIMITPHKMRLRDRVSRSIYVGRDTKCGPRFRARACRASAAATLAKTADVHDNHAFTAYSLIYGNGSKTTMG